MHIHTYIKKKKNSRLSRCGYIVEFLMIDKRTKNEVIKDEQKI